MRQTWTFHSAGQLVFGPGSTAQLGAVAQRLGIRRALLVTDANLAAAGLAERVRAPLVEAGIAVDLFDGGQPEPSLPVIAACRGRAASFAADGLVALGGGSNMDLAKIAAVLLAHGGSPSDYFGENRVPGPVLPLVCLPTTAGSGSEVSCAAVVTDREQGMKVSTLSNYLRPRAAIVDPLLALGCPRRVTADAGIDALTHAIEAYTVIENADFPVPDGHATVFQGRNPLADALAERAIELIAGHLVTAVEQPDNLAAREVMSLAATLAGLAFSNAGVALVHALEYPVGAATHRTHGSGNGLLLPHVMRYNLPARPRQFARIAALLGEDTAGLAEAAAAERAIDAVARLARRLDIPARLRDLDVPESALPAMAAQAFALKRLLRVNPRMPTEADLLEILRWAY